MPGMTEEQEEKLKEINAGKGKDLTAAQKAIVVQYGMKKGGYDPKKPLPDATIPDLKKSGGGSVDIDPGPTKMGEEK